MKKWLFIIMTFLILASCGQTTNDRKKLVAATNPTNSDVTINFRGVDNIERLNQFIDNVQKGTTDKVRLIQYTTEGDPIYQLLSYDGKTLIYARDNTHDSYSNSDNRKKFTYDCQRVNRQETNTFTAYSLEGCPTLQDTDLFTVYHDIKKEDYFAFKLQYGKYNVIDTHKQDLSSKLPNGDVVIVKDFQLPLKVMNDIYKAMIFANYLGEKHFLSECQSKSSDEYELTVWINSGQKHFKWSECDQSPDGKKMTRLAKDIINSVQNTSLYKKILN